MYIMNCMYTNKLVDCSCRIALCFLSGGSFPDKVFEADQFVLLSASHFGGELGQPDFGHCQNCDFWVIISYAPIYAFLNFSARKP